MFVASIAARTILKSVILVWVLNACCKSEAKGDEGNHTEKQARKVSHAQERNCGRERSPLLWKPGCAKSGCETVSTRRNEPATAQ